MNYGFRPQDLAAIIICIVPAIASAPAFANHGPGANGGGSFTLSGETLKPGRFELTLREDFSQFEHFSRSAAEGRAREGGDFDALDRGFITTLDLSYGVAEDFQVGASLGYFLGRGFIGSDLEEDGSSVETATANPEGLTDLVLTGKYRLLRGQPGNLALIAGVVLPTGRTDVRLSNGERLSPTDQPGGGRFGLPAGLGYSRFLTPRITIDASAVYTVRFEKDDFKIGDRFDAGVALAYRLTESINAFPQFSAFVEANEVYLMKDRNHGEREPNSGGNTLYVTPGLRVRFDPNSSLTLAPSFPVMQDLNGNQGNVDFKVSLSYTLAF